MHKASREGEKLLKVNQEEKEVKEEEEEEEEKKKKKRKPLRHLRIIWPRLVPHCSPPGSAGLR